MGMKDTLRCHVLFRSCSEFSLSVVKDLRIGIELDEWRSLLQKHIYSLQPEECLHDETINSFFLILSSLDKKLCEVDKSRRMSHFFYSEFTEYKVIFDNK